MVTTERPAGRSVVGVGDWNGRPLGALAALTSALRAPAFAVTACTVSVGAHIAAGGSAPDVALTAVFVVLAWAAYTLLGRGERSAPQLFGGAGVIQALFHTMLSIGPSAGHAMHTGQAAQFAAGCSAWQMVLAHALADALVVGWLRRGEAAATRAAGWLLRRLVPRVPRLAPVRHTCHRIAAARRPCGINAAVLVRTIPRRGPPLPV